MTSYEEIALPSVSVTSSSSAFLIPSRENSDFYSSDQSTVQGWRLAIRHQLPHMLDRNAKHLAYAKRLGQSDLLEKVARIETDLQVLRRTLIEDACAAVEGHARLVLLQNELDDQIKENLELAGNKKEQKEKKEQEVVKDLREERSRDMWATQTEFFLSCLGFMVGVGNIWRFPSQLYANGGGVFLLPYLACVVCLGLPIVYLHLALGQYAGLSADGVFTKIMPLSSGVGWTLVLLAIPLCIYYNMTVAWSLHYVSQSFSAYASRDHLLPWSRCLPQWTTAYNCCDLNSRAPNLSCFANAQSMTSAEAYFHYQVLNRSPLENCSNGCAELGPIQTPVLVSLAIAWLLTFVCVFHGIASIGWAVYFTTTLPYLILFILLLRGLTLDGARAGIDYLLRPDWSKLWDLSVWRSAAEQVFYSLGIDAGPLITLASYSRFRNNIYRDAVLLVAIDTLTSVLCGTVIFAFVGFLKQRLALTDFSAIIRHDPLYLAYTVYPAVTSQLPGGPLWAALFFIMIIFAALDGEFAWLEMIAAAGRRRASPNRLIGPLCLFCFLAGIPLCSRGGIYIFHAIENFSGNWAAFVLTLIEIFVVCYVYGVNKFLRDMDRMLRRPREGVLSDRSQRPLLRKLADIFGPTGPYIRLSWCLFSPTILIGLFFVSIVNFSRVKFNSVELPIGYELTAWLAMVCPLIICPLMAVYSYRFARNTGKPIQWLWSSTDWENMTIAELETGDDQQEQQGQQGRAVEGGNASDGTRHNSSSQEMDSQIYFSLSTGISEEEEEEEEGNGEIERDRSDSGLSSLRPVSNRSKVSLGQPSSEITLFRLFEEKQEKKSGGRSVPVYGARFARPRPVKTLIRPKPNYRKTSATALSATGQMDKKTDSKTNPTSIESDKNLFNDFSQNQPPPLIDGQKSKSATGEEGIANNSQMDAQTNSGRCQQMQEERDNHREWSVPIFAHSASDPLEPSSSVFAAESAVVEMPKPLFRIETHKTERFDTKDRCVHTVCISGARIRNSSI